MKTNKTKNKLAMITTSRQNETGTLTWTMTFDFRIPIISRIIKRRALYDAETDEKTVCVWITARQDG